MEHFFKLPMDKIPDLEGDFARYYFDWLQHAEYDEYWKEISIEESYSEIQFESYVLDQPSGTSCLPFSEGAPITETSSILSEEDGLGYGISDIAFNGNSFVVANPSD